MTLLHRGQRRGKGSTADDTQDYKPYVPDDDEVLGMRFWLHGSETQSYVVQI